jgi:hypothetical protein
VRRNVSHVFSVIAALAVAVSCGVAAQSALAQPAPISGTVTAVGADQFTLQMPGKAVGVLNALTTAANRVTAQDLPYVWGGGHGQAGVPSKGEAGGPGYNGKRIGYDCSGAVAAVLVAAGLWPNGSAVPNDAGMIQELLAHKLIAKGAGTGPAEVTLYDHPGVHIFMNIDGRFWGTSDGGAGADSNGGAGWLDDGAWDATQPAFRKYHFLPGVLNATTTAGDDVTFGFDGATALASAVGTQVSVSYSTSGYGTMVASAVTYADQQSVVGAVTAIGAADKSFTIQAADDQMITYAVTPASTIAQQLAAGKIAVSAVVTVSYVNKVSTAPTGVTVATPTSTPISVTVDVPPPPSPTGAGITTTG